MKSLFCNALIFLVISLRADGFVLCERQEQVTKTSELTLDGCHMIRVVPQSDQGFSWPYIYFVSPKLDRSKTVTIVVLPPNTGKLYDHYQTTEDLLLGSFVRETRWYQRISERVVYMMPIIPRPASLINFYSHALSSKVLFHGDEKYKRLDLQILAMWKDLRNLLRAEGLEIEPKFGLIGFSASGQLANRMGVLHPQAVRFVVAGGLCGLPVLPAKDIDGQVLTYPVGVSDIQLLPEITTDFQEIYRAPQFFMIGQDDTNDAVGYRDSYSEEQARLVQKQFPGVPYERWKTIMAQFAGKWGLAEFHEYVNIGHKYDQQMVDEACEFMLRIINEQPIEATPISVDSLVAPTTGASQL